MGADVEGWLVGIEVGEDGANVDGLCVGLGDGASVGIRVGNDDGE
jgi:hypothetical protein